jgi:hypothetical protein
VLSTTNYNSSGQSHVGRRSCMLIALATCLLTLRSTCLCQQVGTGPSSNDGLEYQSNGTILLSANGSWPEEQILERLRREYGWVTDYEQTPRLANMVVTSADGSLQAKMHSVSVSIPRPTQASSAEELRVLGALASGLSSADERVTVVQNGGDGRFDILLSAGGAEPILSTAIVIPSQARSVGDTITAILEAVSTRTGQPILLGGIANSSLEITQVTVGETQPLPARVLLAQALDALPTRHVWLLGYEPQMGSYTIGVEPVVRAIRTSSGQVVETLVKAPPKQ